MYRLRHKYFAVQTTIIVQLHTLRIYSSYNPMIEVLLIALARWKVMWGTNIGVS